MYSLNCQKFSTIDESVEELSMKLAVDRFCASAIMNGNHGDKYFQMSHQL